MERDHPLDAESRPAEAPGTTPVIRTPDQRVRVFVSSTLDELAPERAAAREAITQLRLTPVLFELGADRKSTRLNSSHGYISYAVFCLKKKKTNRNMLTFSS